MLKNKISAIFSSIFKRENIFHSPLNIQIEPTTACNLRCKMCIRNDKISSPTNMNETTFNITMQKLTPERVVFAGAGEPLLNPSICYMVSYCASRKIPTLMSTNLSLDYTKAIEVFSAGLSTLKISLDAPNKETYGAIRGNEDNFDIVINNIRRITDNRGDKQDIRLEFVIMKENFALIPDFIRLTKSLSIRRVYFRELQTEGMEEDRRKELLKDFDFVSLRKILIKGMEEARRLCIDTNLKEIIAGYNNLVDIYCRTAPASLGSSCLLPWLQLFVAANGDTAPCCAMYINGGIKTGNVLENNREEILNGIAAKCIRKGFKNENTPPVCRDCIPRDLKKLLRMSNLLPKFGA